MPQYFSHDADARNDPKILALRSVYGYEGYGWYWAIVEMLRQQDNYKIKIGGKYAINAIALELQCKCNALDKFLDDCINEFELFASDGEHIWSESLLRRMEKMEKITEKRRQAAKHRWEPMQMQSKSNANAKQKQCNKTKLNKNKSTNVHANKIFEHWQKCASHITKAKYTKNLETKIETKLKLWNADKMKQAIDNYVEVYNSDYYYKHNWTLYKFIEQGNGAPRFNPGLDEKYDGDIFRDYKKEHTEPSISEPFDTKAALEEREKRFEVNQNAT